MPDFVLASARLVACAIEEDDLDDVLAVRLSNPKRLARTEGSDGEAGRYDRGMLERDVTVADYDPERELLALRLRPDKAHHTTGRVVGLVDLLVTSPTDGHPWLGVVEIAASDQRNGYGREAALAAVAFLRERHHGGHPVRAAVAADDAVALTFARDCGFTERTAPADLSLRGNQVLLELALVPAPIRASTPCSHAPPTIYPEAFYRNGGFTTPQRADLT